MGMIFFYALESSGSLQNFQNHDDLTFIGVLAKEKCFLTSGEKEKWSCNLDLDIALLIYL